MTFLAFISVLFIYARKQVSLSATLFIVTAFGFNSYFYSFLNNNILSDIHFLFFSTLGAFYLDDIITRKQIKLKNMLLFTFIAFLGTTIRTNGVLLFMLIPFVQVIAIIRDKNKDILFYILPYVFYLLLYFIYSTLFPINEKLGTSYIRLSWDSLLLMLNYNFSVFPSFFPIQVNYRSILFFITIPFFLYGIKKNFKKNFFLILYSAMVIGLYSIYVSRQGLRFLFPVLPFYVYFLSIGISACCKRLKEKYVYLIICSVFLYQTASWVLYNNNIIQNTPYSIEAQEAFQYIRDNTSQDSSIVFFKPRVLRMLTMRNGIIRSRFDENMDYDYFLYYKQDKLISLEKIAELEENNKITKVFFNDEFALYKVNQ